VAKGGQAIQVAGRAVVRISSDAGRVSIVAEDRADVRVDVGRVQVDPTDPSRIRIDSVLSRVEARVPTGTDVVVGTGSGRVDLKGRFGAASIASTTGRVSIDEAESVDARVGSGRVEIGRCDGVCRVNAGSGRTHIGSSGETDVMVESGSIEIGEIRGPARLKTTSGRIEVRLDGRHDLDAESVSGRITIHVPADLHPDVTLASRGRTRCGVATGAAPTIRARSVSGRLEVVEVGGRRTR
jgi:DUF4097 and DUF4098 domain-containing protein YvlB